MKIAILLNENGNIVNVNNTNDDGAQKQSSLDGSIVVEADLNFKIEDIDKWTVRKSDNKLVHISTGMTPDEESTQANALLGKNVGVALAQSNTANTTANNALDIANKSVAANAEIGKLIAPLLAAQQSSTNTTGGTN